MLENAAWREPLKGMQPSAQELLTVALASSELEGLYKGKCMRDDCESPEVLTAFEGWEQGMAEALKESFMGEMHAAQFLAVVYHARLSQHA
jgi:hypothetical protein